MPGKIGPHTGRELELLLAGSKPVAMFSDWVGHEDFEHSVRVGRLVRVVREEPGDLHPHTYYARPENPALIADLDRAVRRSLHLRGEDLVENEREIGRLLGYSPEDVERWIRRVRKKWAGRRRNNVSSE